MIASASREFLPVGLPDARQRDRLLREFARTCGATLQDQQAPVVEPRQPVIRRERQRALVSLSRRVELAQRLQRRGQLVQQVGRSRLQFHRALVGIAAQPQIALGRV